MSQLMGKKSPDDLNTVNLLKQLLEDVESWLDPESQRLPTQQKADIINLYARCQVLPVEEVAESILMSRLIRRRAEAAKSKAK